MSGRVPARLRARLAMTWSSIEEPRRVTVWAMITYVLIIAIGSVIWLAAPVPMNHLDIATRVLVSVMLIGGGCVGVPAAWLGAWRVERVAPIACGFGLLSTAAVIADLHVADPTPPPTLTIVLLLLGVALSSLATRWERLRVKARSVGRVRHSAPVPPCEDALAAVYRSYGRTGL